MSANASPPARPRAIFCIDLDAFYVSVERRLRPELEGRPVVVGARGMRGVVVAASYEVRRHGVRSAMPIAEAERLLSGVPDVTWLAPSHGAYEEHSAHVRAVLDRELPVVEAASIDEFYADVGSFVFPGLRGPRGDPLALAEHVAARIRAECGLPASIGIATSKLVAKIASDEAKPRGLLRVLPGREGAFLAPLAIERLPGVGPRTAPQLHQAGVRTVADVPRAGEHALRAAVGEGMAAWLHEAAAGRDAAPVIAHEEARSIGHEETFERDVGALEALNAIAGDIAARLAHRLRAEGLLARTVQVKMRYAARRQAYVPGALARDVYETITRARTGPPTCDDLEIAARARALVREHWREGEPLRLFGVSVRNFAAADRQATLFDPPETRREERLHGALDAIREKFGFDSVFRASARRPDA